ncbi:hypothetical protein BH18ACI3_BH18ACI3_09990 [soil metagenome]
MMKFSRGIDMSLVVEITNIENLKKEGICLVRNPTAKRWNLL